MATHIKSGSAAANKIFNAALFTEATRANSFENMLTGPAPKTPNAAKADGNRQTSAGAPVVRITDLEKTAGDEVTVDLFHQLRHKPVMGDEKIAGRGASLTSSQYTLKIDQGRTMVDSGGRMTQQRTSHDLKSLARVMLSPYYNRLADQIALVHLAGARGTHDDADWILPTENDPDFNRIMVNPVQPPTFDRHFYGGDATSLANMTTADQFSVDAVDRIRLALDEMAFPLQPIRFPGDQQAEDNPFFVLMVTPRQWYDFWTSTSGDSWRQLVANAYSRATGWNHPVFKGDVAMWNNILIRKMTRPIRFEAGASVPVATDTDNATTTTVTAAVRTERAILLGAQALASAFGRAGSRTNGYYFNMHTEVTDHGNVLEHSIAWMNGKGKIRFRGSDGRVNDLGVAVLDTAVSTV